MPTYTYQCTSCTETFDEILKVADRHLPTEKPCSMCNGKLEIKMFAVALGDPVRLGVMKPKSDFKEVLQQIKRNNPGSTLDT